MKRVKRRAIFALGITILVALGLIFFLFKLGTSARDWVGFFSGSGQTESGTIYDREGVMLYDGEHYAQDRETRVSTMHLVGGRNIGTSIRNVQASHLSGYNVVTGTALGGHDIKLTIDAKLNEIAYSAMNGRNGVVSVYNYETGEILCLVSTPSFDPSDPPKDLDRNPNYEGAYLNRFFSSTFTPGSIFKLVTAAAALETLPGLSEFRYDCTGSMLVGGVQITCPKKHGMGMTWGEALARSCNGAYAQLALELGGKTLEKYTRQAGLLESQVVSGIHTASGKCEVAEDGSPDLAWSGVGQAETLVNPCSFLTLMGGIARGGEAVTPRLIAKETFKGTDIPAGWGERKHKTTIWKKETCDSLSQMMRTAVQETYGQSSFGDLAVCAKSGTAEVGNEKEPHAWFTGFIEDPANPLAFVVLVENGGSGSRTAGSIAAKVLLAATE